jgi:DNA-directed RNA polymerase specialized sigma24 family protein
MRAEEQFDSFYLKYRRALVHQTFALTGDLAAAQRAVRDSYVAAWHHWRKVKGHDDPRDWVRPRAWAQAQRRHTARLWQRTRDLSTEDRRILDALHKIPMAERRALIMVEIAGVPLDVGARDLSLTQETLARQHRSAAQAFATALEIDPESVRPHLMSLADAAANATLPRAAAVRREGRNRRRTHTVAAAAAVIFLAVGTGAFAHEPPNGETATADSVAAPAEEPSTSAPPVEESTLPSADDLLTPQDVHRLDPGARWRVSRTDDNTGGEGINYVCQRERFADPEGLGGIVRVTKAPGGGGVRTNTQAVEISRSVDDAATTYSTVLDWFTGCKEGKVHLRRVFDVTGVAEHAAVLELESWSLPRTTYSVAVAQVGQVVTTSVVESADGDAPNPPQVAKTLGVASTALCERAGQADCGGKPQLEFSNPPPSGETPGLLATVDLPPLDGVGRPWVGTAPAPAGKNPAATSCDRADFRKAGASGSRTRTFLVPEAKLPDRFGLTETYGTFKSAKSASKFMRTIRGRFAKCEDRDLATEIVAAGAADAGRLDGSTWRLHTELSASRLVVYDVGFVRRGASVAQLTLVPAGKADLSTPAFRALLLRAGQRLAELD